MVEVQDAQRGQLGEGLQVTHLSAFDVEVFELPQGLQRGEVGHGCAAQVEQHQLRQVCQGGQVGDGRFAQAQHAQGGKGLQGRDVPHGGLAQIELFEAGKARQHRQVAEGRTSQFEFAQVVGVAQGRQVGYPRLVGAQHFQPREAAQRHQRFGKCIGDVEPPQVGKFVERLQFPQFRFAGEVERFEGYNFLLSAVGGRVAGEV